MNWAPMGSPSVDVPTRTTADGHPVTLYVAV
jgi:hypothetical protein